MGVNEETKMFDLSKRYKYRNGKKPAAVLRDENGVLRSILGTEALTHKETGKAFLPKRGYDLIEVSPYDDWEMDAPIVAWNTNKEFGSRCHFAGISKNGRPLVHANGMTSFTNVENRTSERQHAELWEGDDD